ncbi:ejaculatory bulb-specific protein 3-like [Planococcus citri]|uniref:ejaculatory bulb-specific protein 3-like n=1 Tax=Planococcus citri TaxID=170843 RepID=UPI0031F90CC9
MNSFSVLAIVLCAFVCYTCAQGGQQGQTSYTTRYDNINLDEILSSKRLVNNYVQCLVNGKPCSPEGLELRRILPDALKTKCAKCSQKQKEGALKVIQTVQKDYPEDWKKLVAKWDPNGEYFKAFQQEVAAGRL